MNIDDCINAIDGMIGELGYFNSPWSDEIQDFVQDKMVEVTDALNSLQKQKIQDEEIYFVYERFVFYESNNCDIDKNLLGCFKKYDSAKDCMNEFFTNIQTKFPKEELNRKLEPKSCTCCGEIEGYGYWAGDALVEVSIYKCIPH